MPCNQEAAGIKIYNTYEQVEDADCEYPLDSAIYPFKKILMYVAPKCRHTWGPFLVEMLFVFLGK